MCLFPDLVHQNASVTYIVLNLGINIFTATFIEKETK